MNTTSVFVELIVIGTGPAVCMALIGLRIFDISWDKALYGNNLSLPVLFLFLSLVYVFGIVTDRIADFIFDKWWKEKLRKKVYKKYGADFDDRRTIYIHSGRLGDLLEYGRSRIRISRGWVLNSVLIVICLNIFVWSPQVNSEHRLSISIFGSVSFIIFALLNWYAWRNLTLTEYKKVKKQSLFLRSEVATKGKDKKKME